MRSTIIRLAKALAILGATAGCQNVELRQEAIDRTANVATAMQTPRKAVTSLSGGLRCMDDLLISYGAKGIPVLVEDIADSTKKVNAGAKDMLITALSDMTRRSDGIKLIAYGPDASNLTNMMAASMLTPGSFVLSFSLKPSYAIRGSITQLDENIVRTREQGGIQIGPFGAGSAGSASTSLLGVDLNVISAADFTAVAGVSTSNSLLIIKEGKGIDADVLYKKFGINYEMSLEKSEGQAHALRTLVQLAAIELVGKLHKVPYWRCLGVDTTNETVIQEALDWHYNMSRKGELIAYMQQQYRLRGWYAGPIDGNDSQEFARASERAAAALGIAGVKVSDGKMLLALFSSDTSTPQILSGKEDENIDVRISSQDGKSVYGRGQVVNLAVQVNEPAYVYCYMQDESGAIRRIYPNRHVADNHILPGRALLIPGTMPFKIVTSQSGRKEAVACFGSRTSLRHLLADTVWGGDFAPLKITSIRTVQAAIVQAGGPSTGVDAYLIDVR